MHRLAPDRAGRRALPLAMSRRWIECGFGPHRGDVSVLSSLLAMTATLVCAWGRVDRRFVHRRLGVARLLIVPCAAAVGYFRPVGTSTTVCTSILRIGSRSARGRRVPATRFMRTIGVPALPRRALRVPAFAALVGAGHQAGSSAIDISSGGPLDRLPQSQLRDGVAPLPVVPGTAVAVAGPLRYTERSGRGTALGSGEASMSTSCRHNLSALSLVGAASAWARRGDETPERV